MSAVDAEFALLDAGELRAHEQVEAEAVAELARAIREAGALERPVVIDRATHVILDGHHRFAALRELGCSLVPCFLVDYSDEAITVERWDGEGALEKEQVLRAADLERPLPPKTSRHRSLRDLPDHPTPLSELGQLARQGDRP